MAKMLRTSSSTMSTFLPATFSPSSRLVRSISRALTGSFSSMRWRKRAVSESSFSGEESALLSTTDSAYFFKSCSSRSDRSLPV